MFRGFDPITTHEWQLIFVPLLLVLMIAVIIEVRTTKIPNWLSASTLIYLLTVRCSIGPSSAWSYLASFTLGLVVFVFLGWRLELIGAGAAKLGLSIIVALTILESFIFCVSLCLITLLVRRIGRQLKIKIFPGSILLAVTYVIYLGFRLLN